MKMYLTFRLIGFLRRVEIISVGHTRILARYICKYVADVSLSTFLGRVGIVSDEETRFTARYVSSMRIYLISNPIGFLRQVESVSGRQTTIVARYMSSMKIRSWRLVAYIPTTNRSCKWELDNAYYTFRIEYMNTQLTPCLTEFF